MVLFFLEKRALFKGTQAKAPVEVLSKDHIIGAAVILETLEQINIEWVNHKLREGLTLIHDETGVHAVALLIGVNVRVCVCVRVSGLRTLGTLRLFSSFEVDEFVRVGFVTAFC